ncbi:MAG: hypothetical protein FJ076_02975 [Cyanobacteria bacterium K_DeepCast_35m_m1_288]|nr:hypothetical protein [Cyanobacteria bacterium K_DeepCast_35m_m1_288]
MGRRLLHCWLTNAVAFAATALTSGAVQAAEMCTGPGVPVGCVEVEAAPVRVYGRPVLPLGVRW